MEPEVLVTFFDRILGAFIFIAAVTVVTLLVNQINSYSTATKANYADDGVYSESSLAVTDETVVSRDELKALLTGCPNGSITVQDIVSGWVLEVTSGIGIENSIKFAQGTDFGDEATVIVFGKDRWDPTKLDLDKWIQASSFKMKEITAKDGSVKTVMYYGEA